MILVYFETNTFAIKVAKFGDEEIYMRCLPALEAYALECGYTKVTESEV